MNGGLQQFEPRTEVPDDSIFGRMPERLAPHIYSEQEILDLLAAARRLKPAPGQRGAVYEMRFGLIASTGMRLSEALTLRNEDVALKYGVLLSIKANSASHARFPCIPVPSKRYAGICGSAISLATLPGRE